MAWGDNHNTAPQSATDILLEKHVITADDPDFAEIDAAYLAVKNL